jgi:hypothetical protein
MTSLAIKIGQLSSTLEANMDTLALKIEQISGALDSLAALPPQEFDEEGNPIPGPFDVEYPIARDSIVQAGGPDFQTGLALTGYDPASIPLLALRASLVSCLQFAYTTRWLQTPP